MKALVICPSERPVLALLSVNEPLVNLPIYGKPLAFYWIEFLASQGAKEITLLATDRPERVRAQVGDGGRWGVKIDVIPELRELSMADARRKYQADAANWLAAPNDICIADTLPTRREEPLFTSYHSFYSAIARFHSCVDTNDRIGLRQVLPGVWAARRAQIASSAKLIAPCWIGENVAIGPNAVIGPGAIIEDCCFIDAEAEVSNSIVASETFVGKATSIRNSIAMGNLLINWETDSHICIEDQFLMCDLKRHKPVRRGRTSSLGRITAAGLLLATSPLVLFWALQSWFRGQSFVQQRRAVQPGSEDQMIEYFEFTNSPHLFRRWPQLLNVMRGEFAWVGNRPLTPAEAQMLTNDFEKLWLAAPIGLFSQADAAGCLHAFNDEAKAHASFYAAQANRRLDTKILLQVLRNFPKLKQGTTFSLGSPAVSPKTLSLSDTVFR